MGCSMRLAVISAQYRIPCGKALGRRFLRAFNHSEPRPTVCQEVEETPESLKLVPRPCLVKYQAGDICDIDRKMDVCTIEI